MTHSREGETRSGTTVPGVLAGIAVVIGLSACSSEPPPASNTPKPIAWAVAEAPSEARTRSITGVLRAPERAPMGFEVPGRVAEVNVDTGDDFDKGDVLATLDDRRLALTLAQRKAELAEARSALNLASSENQRARRLLGSRAISEVAFRMRSTEPDNAPKAEIPIAAVAAGEGQQAFVYVYDKTDNTLHRRDVSVADISRDRALIQTGLDPGEIVASRGVAFLHGGQSVTRLGVGVAQFNE